MNDRFLITELDIKPKTKIYKPTLSPRQVILNVKKLYKPLHYP